MKYQLANPIQRKKAKIKFDKACEKGENGESSIINISFPRKAKTIKQNAYMHVCITIFAIEYGWTLHEAKVHLKRNCNYEFVKYERNGELFLKSVAKYSQEESALFIDFIRDYAGKKGCYIPTSQEYLDQKHAIDIEIEKHKKHL